MELGTALVAVLSVSDIFVYYTSVYNYDAKLGL